MYFTGLIFRIVPSPLGQKAPISSGIGLANEIDVAKRREHDDIERQFYDAKVSALIGLAPQL